MSDIELPGKKGKVIVAETIRDFNNFGSDGYLAKLRADTAALERRFRDGDRQDAEPPLDILPGDWDAGDAATQRRRDAETHTYGENGAQSSSPKVCVTVSSASPVSQADDAYLASVLESAKRSEPPEASRYHVPGLRLLVALCKALQDAKGDRPFFLGCRSAGKLLDVPFQRAAKWLRRLTHDGIIELVTKGSKATGMASEYRFIAGGATE